MSILYKAFIALREMFSKDSSRCILCGHEHNTTDTCGFCDDCYEKLPKNNGKICLKCGRPLASESNYCLTCKDYKRVFDRAYAPLIYEGLTIKLITNLKYYNTNTYYKLAKLLIDEIKKHDIPYDIVTFVPLSKKDEKTRETSLAYSMASIVAKETAIPFANNITKDHNSIERHHLNAKERKKDYSKSFHLLDKKLFYNKNVLLIDDILTTGTTANSVSTVIKTAKPLSITVLCLAITPYRIKVSY